MIDALQLDLSCALGPQRDRAQAAPVDGQPCVRMSVRFRVRPQHAEQDPGPLLGRVEIHGGAGGRRWRLFELVPGFLVDLAAEAEQHFEFDGDVMLVPPVPSAPVRATALRLSGRSLPVTSRPVWLTLEQRGPLREVVGDALEAVVLLRAIASGSRFSHRSEPAPVSVVCALLTMLAQPARERLN